MTAMKLIALAAALAAIGVAQAQALKAERAQKTEAQQAAEKAAAQKAADQANDKSVTISSPADKSKISGNGTKIVFDVVPAAAVAAVPTASKADHVHVFVDGDKVATLRELRGSYTVDKQLIAGTHWLCVRVVDRAETPVGLEKCVTVLAGNVPPMGY